MNQSDQCIWKLVAGPSTWILYGAFSVDFYGCSPDSLWILGPILRQQHHSDATMPTVMNPGLQLITSWIDWTRYRLSWCGLNIHLMALPWSQVGVDVSSAVCCLCSCEVRHNVRLVVLHRKAL